MADSQQILFCLRSLSGSSLNYEAKNILCRPKKTPLPSGRRNNLVVLTPVGAVTHFPRGEHYKIVSVARKANWIPCFCGLEGALQINSVPQPLSRDITETSMWNFFFFFNIRILLQICYFLHHLFFFIAVVRRTQRTILRKVLWRVKSENPFIPSDSVFLTEVHFTCTSTTKNKI